MSDQISSLDAKHLLTKSALQSSRSLFNKCYSNSCLSLRDPTQFIIEVKKLEILLSTEISSIIEDLYFLDLKNIGSKLALIWRISSDIIEECSSKCNYFFQELSLEQGRRRSTNKERLCSHCRKGLLMAELEKGGIPIIHGIISQEERDLDGSFSSAEESLDLTAHISDRKKRALALQPSEAARKLSEVLNLAIDQTDNFIIDEKQIMKIGQYQQRFEEIKSKVKTNIAHTLEKTFVTLRKKNDKKRESYAQKIKHQEVQTTSWQVEEELKTLEIKREALSKTIAWERNLKEDIREQLKECVSNLERTKQVVQSLEIKINNAEEEIKSKKEIISTNQKQIDDLHKKLMMKEEEKQSADIKIRQFKEEIFSCENKIVKLNQKISGKIREHTKDAGSQTLNTIKIDMETKEDVKISPFKSIIRANSKSPKIEKKTSIGGRQEGSEGGKIEGYYKTKRESPSTTELAKSKGFKAKFQEKRIRQTIFNQESKNNILLEENSKPTTFHQNETNLKQEHAKQRKQRGSKEERQEKQQRQSIVLQQVFKEESKMDYNRLRSSKLLNPQDLSKTRNARVHTLSKVTPLGSVTYPIPVVAPIHAMSNGFQTYGQSYPREKLSKINRQTLFRINQSNLERQDEKENTLHPIYLQIVNHFNYNVEKIEKIPPKHKRSNKFSNSMEQHQTSRVRDKLKQTIHRATHNTHNPFQTEKKSILELRTSFEEERIQNKEMEMENNSMLPDRKNKLKLNIKSLSKYTRRPNNDWLAELKYYLNSFASAEKSQSDVIETAFLLYEKVKIVEKNNAQKFGHLKSELVQRFYKFERTEKEIMLILSLMELVSSHYQACEREECLHLIKFGDFLSNVYPKVLKK